MIQQCNGWTCAPVANRSFSVLLTCSSSTELECCLDTVPGKISLVCGPPAFEKTFLWLSEQTVFPTVFLLLALLLAAYDTAPCRWPAPWRYVTLEAVLAQQQNCYNNHSTPRPARKIIVSMERHSRSTSCCFKIKAFETTANSVVPPKLFPPTDTPRPWIATLNSHHSSSNVADFAYCLVPNIENTRATTPLSPYQGQLPFSFQRRKTEDIQRNKCIAWHCHVFLKAKHDSSCAKVSPFTGSSKYAVLPRSFAKF